MSCSMQHAHGPPAFCLQVTVWVIVPHLLSSGTPLRAPTALLFALLLQYLLRLLRTLALARSFQRVVGYIFGGAWWGFIINFAAYCAAAHVRTPWL